MFERSDTAEIHDGIMLAFLPGTVTYVFMVGMYF